MVAYLQRRHYGPHGRPLRACHPRDLLDQVTALCRYRGIEPVITRELLDAACEAYFVDEPAGGRVAPQRRTTAGGSWRFIDATGSRRARVSGPAGARGRQRAVLAAVGRTCSATSCGRGHVTGLLLLASESLVVVLTIVRRRAHLIVDRSAWA